MKIALFEVAKTEQDILKGLLGDLSVSLSEEKLNDTTVKQISNAEIISVFTNSMVSKEIIDQLPNLKLVNTSSTGFDHIDVEYCKQKNIKVSNVPAYGSVTVAEFTFALILNLSRKVYDAYHNLREDGNFDISALCGFDLEGKTIGVIGTGKIGKNVIKMAKGFSMNVMAYDLYPDEAFAKENNFIYKSLDEVITEADIITLHAPYTKENHHLINKEKISLMKKGVYLINTARGELIDTGALIWGLNECIIAGAGLDVLEGERELKEESAILADSDRAERVKNYKTLLEDRVLIDLPNVIVTPHIAFDTKEAGRRILETTVANIKGFLDNNPVNLLK